MNRLIVNLKRIAIHLKNFFCGVTNSATKGTGIAIKTVGNTIGAGMAFLVLMVIVFIIGLVAIPYGAFSSSRDSPSKTETWCKHCGVVETN